MIATRRRAPSRVREPGGAYGSALPGPLYCDTSALVKLYVPESGSDELNRTVEGRDDLLVSDLAVTEIVSALSRPGAAARAGARPWRAATAGWRTPS